MIANLSTATLMSLLVTLGPADGVVNNFSIGVGGVAEGEDADNVAMKKNKTINVDKPGEFLVLFVVLVQRFYARRSLVRNHDL